MSRIRIAVLTLLLLALMIMPALVSAQAQKPAAVTQQSAASYNEAYAQYQLQKKNEVVAAVLGGVAPMLGTSFAGNTRSGLVPQIVSAGGFLLAIVGSTQHSVSCGGGLYASCSSNSSPLMPIGVVAYLAGNVWGAIKSYNTATEYNVALQSRLHLNQQTAAR